MARQRAGDQAQAAFGRIGTAPPEQQRTSQDHDASASRSHDVTPSQRHDLAASAGHDVTASPAHESPTSLVHDATTSWNIDTTTPRVPEARTSRRRRGPAAADAVAFTVRFDPDEAIAVDELTLTLRPPVGRRVDKSELVRTLLRLARDRHDLRTVLAEQLRDDDTP